MVSSFLSLFQSTFVHAEKDPAAGVRRRLASEPAPQVASLVANEDLRGFLKSVFRLHEEKRIAADHWAGIAHFLMRVKKDAPRSVQHLQRQWPRAVESWATVRDLLRTPRTEGAEPPSKTMAKLQALLAHLKQHARQQSWLSHGFDVEFSKMADDRVAVASRRIEVMQLAATRIGPMSVEQLQDCRERIATVLELLTEDAYPCIRDVLCRISNEANWQLALFSPSKKALAQPSSGRPLSAAACP